MSISSQPSYIIPIEELQFVKKIGDGGFGVVYKAKWKAIIVAVKSIDIDETIVKSQVYLFLLNIRRCQQSENPKKLTSEPSMDCCAYQSQ